MKYLVFGLGNMGVEYRETRHNIGFMVLDWLAGDVPFTPTRHALQAEISYRGRKFILLKPTTFMNLSGKAVAHHIQAHKIDVERTMVVTDDLALALGTVRLRQQGSNGGHNGLKHIQQTLGHPKYPRFRIGIGADFPPGQQVDYVLSPFQEDEWPMVQAVVEHVGQAILEWGFTGIDQVMTKYNGTIKQK